MCIRDRCRTIQRCSTRSACGCFRRRRSPRRRSRPWTPGLSPRRWSPEGIMSKDKNKENKNKKNIKKEKGRAQLNTPSPFCMPPVPVFSFVLFSPSPVLYVFSFSRVLSFSLSLFSLFRRHRSSLASSSCWWSLFCAFSSWSPYLPSLPASLQVYVLSCVLSCWFNIN